MVPAWRALELDLERGAAINLDGLDRERHLDVTFARNADAAGARLNALPSSAMLTNRVDLDQAVGLSGLRSGGNRYAEVSFDYFQPTPCVYDRNAKELAVTVFGYHLSRRVSILFCRPVTIG
jgi:hypothetical protein